MRDRGRGLTVRVLQRRTGSAIARTALLALVLLGCQEPDPRYLPDAVLRSELGLTDEDRVHTVRVTGGLRESADPSTDSVPTGAWVQFVTTDWLVHEILFELDSIPRAARDFLERTEQDRSPPLIHQDARFVVSLDGAPSGRYRYRIEGNGEPGFGSLVVFDPDAPAPVRATSR